MKDFQFALNCAYKCGTLIELRSIHRIHTLHKECGQRKTHSLCWRLAQSHWFHGPLTRYAKLQVAHAPGMPGTFTPAADFEGNCFLAIPACITARALRTCRDACRDRLPAATGKTFPAFPAHAHPQFCVPGKRSMHLYMEVWLFIVMNF